jgi:hypothetical protein
VSPFRVTEGKGDADEVPSEAPCLQRPSVETREGRRP